MKLLTTTLVALGLGVSAAAHGASPVRTVALTGQVAPEGPTGATLHLFRNVSLNATGSVTFLATLSGGGVDSATDDGIWSADDGSLRLVAREGTQAPGAATGVVFGELNPPVINSVGQVAFSSALAGVGVNSANDEGIWSEGAGPLAMVARNGAPAPGMDEGIVFDGLQLHFGVVPLSDDGDTAFLATLKYADGSAIKSKGIWSGKFGSVRLIARTNDGDHPLANGGMFSSLNYSLVMGSGGPVAFIGIESSANDPAVRRQSLWVERNDSLELGARLGDAAAGAPSGYAFSAMYVPDSSYLPAINATGDIAFIAALQESPTDFQGVESLWATHNGELRLVTLASDPLPGVPPDVQFDYFASAPVIGNGGAIAWMTRMKGDSVTVENALGIWSNRNGVVELVLRQGDEAPGAPMGESFVAISTPVINDSGNVAFSATTSGNLMGIWAQDVAGALRAIVVSGDLLEVAPGDFRQVTAVIFTGPYLGGGDAHPRGFNDRGQIAFTAFFSDGSAGVFVSNLVAVPEPSSAGLVMFGVAGLARRNWKRRVGRHPA